jgi:hypothetical protein
VNRMIFFLIMALPTGSEALVYKCAGPEQVVTYTSDPSPDKNCVAIDLKVSEPDPADVARATEQKRLDEESEKAEARERIEQETAQAQSFAAADAQRRAEAAEAELRYLRQQPQGGGYWQPVYPMAGIFPYTYTRPMPSGPFPQRPFYSQPFPNVPFPGAEQYSPVHEHRDFSPGYRSFGAPEGFGSHQAPMAPPRPAGR